MGRRSGSGGLSTGSRKAARTAYLLHGAGIGNRGPAAHLLGSTSGSLASAGPVRPRQAASYRASAPSPARRGTPDAIPTAVWRRRNANVFWLNSSTFS
jgi:hypothetical protein